MIVLTTIVYMDKETYNARQRERRRANGNAPCKKYEKTKAGFLMRLYRNMQSRVNGIQWRKFHLYEGKDLLPREDFYQWANTSEKFHELFAAWELSSHDRRITPSVDRIDSDRGYTLDNMRWVPFHENCAHVRQETRRNLKQLYAEKGYI